MRTALKIATATALALATGGAFAADLVAFSAAAVKSSLADLPMAFQEQTGRAVHFEYGTAGAMRDKAMQGESFDVIIVTPSAMKALEAKSLVDAKSELTLGTTSLGAGVAKGHSAPDIGTVASFKKTLLSASSIGIADPARGATTGIYLAQLFEKLGLSEQIKNKVKVFPDGQNAMEAAARGEVEIALGQISEAAPVKGLGPLTFLPDDVQLRTVYVAAIAAKAPNRAAAAMLLETVKSAPIQQALQANGFATSH
ncbi:MAG TPA: substrate-binding domain-containing protein [Herbaspirillum sp.]|jgi:molybdate transport system substrate-binding protein|nr:substrate-binding domain-containing protein [Herbaspirillum sp.]